MNFDPVKYVNETLSRGEKLTLLHFLRSLIGCYLTQGFCPIKDRKKWTEVNFPPRDKFSFTYLTGSKFISPGILHRRTKKHKACYIEILGRVEK